MGNVAACFGVAMSKKSFFDREDQLVGNANVLHSADAAASAVRMPSVSGGVEGEVVPGPATAGLKMASHKQALTSGGPELVVVLVDVRVEAFPENS